MKSIVIPHFQSKTDGDLLVSVIIPHYNDEANLTRCLDLLRGQTLPRALFEIVVADNNSRCGFDAFKKICGDDVVAVPAPIQGAGEARNAAVAGSRGRILAFIDSDCRPSPTWIENGVNALLNSKSSVIGGRVDVDVVDAKNPSAAESFEKVFAFNFKEYIEKKNFTGSGNMFVGRTVFDEVGGFRIGVAEDFDWGQRATAMGHRIKYADDVVVSHPARKDFFELCGKWKRLTREAYLATIEKKHGKALWFARSFVILLSPPMHILAILRSKKISGAKQRVKAIGALLYIRGWRFFECYKLAMQ